MQMNPINAQNQFASIRIKWKKYHLHFELNIHL